MYEAPDLSPNPVISSINPGVSFGSAYDGQTRDYHGDSDQVSGGSLCNEDVDEIEGMMSEEAFALLLPEPGRPNAENTMENPLIDLSVPNTQIQRMRTSSSALLSKLRAIEILVIRAPWPPCSNPACSNQISSRVTPKSSHLPSIFRSLRMNRKERLMSENMNPPPSPGTDDKKENTEDHDIMVLLNITPQFQGRSASMLYPQDLDLAASSNGGI